MEKESVLAEDSFDRSEVKFPSHNYYIMFDKKNKNKKNFRGGISNDFTKTVCLENKVKRLEDEVRVLRTNGVFNSTTFKKDGKMRLDQLLDSILG